MKMSQASRLVGDNFMLTLARSPYKLAGGQAGWGYEIISKEISAFPAQIDIKGRDLSAIAGNIGFWMADTAPAWASATAAQRNDSGFWLDSNGYAEPADEESKNVSIWW